MTSNLLIPGLPLRHKGAAAVCAAGGQERSLHLPTSETNRRQNLYYSAGHMAEAQTEPHVLGPVLHARTMANPKGGKPAIYIDDVGLVDELQGVSSLYLAATMLLRTAGWYQSVLSLKDGCAGTASQPLGEAHVVLREQQIRPECLLHGGH